ncbi:MAG: acyl--CoA ligase [Anaerolineae bacterium]|nr:acyl--CoA ligase [Anaerolineae bacterium]
MLNTRMTMFQAFDEVATSRPGNLALVCGEERLTYGQLRERTLAAARALAARGIGKGDRVATLLPPGVPFVVLFFALARLGGVVVPLNPQSRPRLLRYILEDCQPRLLVAEREALPRDSLAFLEGPEAAGLLPEGILWAGPEVEALWAEPGEPPQVDVAPTDLLCILYTSGTTGMPKGTLHTHRSLIAPVAASLRVRRAWLHRPSPKTLPRMAKALARYGERLLRAAGRPQVFLTSIGPFAIAGLEVMLQALLMGDALIWQRRFHPRETLQTIQDEKVTILVAVPTALAVLLRMEDLDQYDVSSLLICGTGSAPCPAELARQVRERFGCAMHIGFGTTELGGGIAVTELDDPDEAQVETVGRPMPGIEVRIVDDEGRPLPPGQVGELVCRSEGLMAGYLKAPDQTAEVIDEEGWYHTGDLATMDERGYIRIVGRKKDLIIRGGQNVYPAEIEGYLVGHPAIREAAVVGVPGELGREEIWAFIIREPDADLTEQEVIAYCREALEAYKIPDQVRFVEDFPRSALGKPQKFVLREQALREKGASQPG